MPLDDDDNPLEGVAIAATEGENTPTAEETMEDEMPDYNLFASMFEKKGVSSKTIRKGEKDFEQHGTRSQHSALEQSRRALEDVLSYTRTHRPDNWTRGFCFPDWWIDEQNVATDYEGMWLKDRVVVMEHERGSWMKDIGRVAIGSREQLGIGKLWLLPEEALYLIERGTVDLWWPWMEFEELLPRGSPSSSQIRKGFGINDYDAGIPLSLESAYSIFIGFEGERGKITLPKYQVFTHLKRAGYIIMRAPLEEQLEPVAPPPMTLWQWFFSILNWEGQPKQKPFGPLIEPGLYRGYRSVYQRLALLPRHNPLAPISTPATPNHTPPEEPFRVHFHVWKPGATGFSKKKPPPPDFRIAVTDTYETFVPTLEQIGTLLEATPYDPAPEIWQGPGKLYQRLKHGHRNVLVAVVDRGLVNFMRFGEGAFGEEKLYERFDSNGGRGRGRGGKRGGGGGGGRGGRGRGRGGGGRGRGRGG